MRRRGVEGLGIVSKHSPRQHLIQQSQNTRTTLGAHVHSVFQTSSAKPTAESGCVDVRLVHEDVRPPIRLSDEPESLLTIEPLHLRSSREFNACPRGMVRYNFAAAYESDSVDCRCRSS